MEEKAAASVVMLEAIARHCVILELWRFALSLI
jgi:hypothetical protein